MKQNRHILTLTIIFAVSILVISFYPSLQGGQNYKEVQPEINVNRYLTDNTQPKDAYERLMDRYIDLLEKNISEDLETTTKNIESIEAKLTELCERTARIEKALGIEPIPEPEQKQLNVLENKEQQQEP